MKGEQDSSAVLSASVGEMYKINKIHMVYYDDEEEDSRLPLSDESFSWSL